MADLDVDPGPEVVMNFEPVPRGPVLTSGGTLSRAYLNWFNGQDRMLGEIVSGVNRYRQTIVSLATATETELGILEASVTSVAEVATDAETAVATLSSEVTAARQGEANLSARITQVDQARVSGDSANASSISTVSATVSGLSATVTTQATAIATIEGNLSAKFAIEVDGGGNGAFVSLEDGTEAPSAISLTADKITLDGDVIVTGTLTTAKLAANAATAIQVTETAGTRSLTHDVWTTIATHSIAVGSGERVQFTGQLDIVTLTASGGNVNLPMLEARVQRAGSTIKERNLALGPAPRFSSPVFYTSDSPAAGTYSYTFQVRFKDYGDSTTRSCTIEDEFFESTLVKR